MKDESKKTVQSALFHRVQGSIFADGKYTYRVFSVYERDLESGEILDINRLRKRLLDKIIKMNNDRINRYPEI